jgi:hypothetical protein
MSTTYPIAYSHAQFADPGSISEEHPCYRYE